MINKPLYVKLISLFAAVAALTGCGHNLYITSRTTSAKATARIVTIPMHPSGDVTIVINNKSYIGRWIYMAGGGAVGLGTATVVSGSHVATGNSMFAALPTGGNGTIITSASDGSKLRCVYSYSEWNSTGVGVCEDNKGEVYDLQIN